MIDQHMRVQDLIEALAGRDPLAFVYACGPDEAGDDIGFMVCSVRTTDPNYVELELA